MEAQNTSVGAVGKKSVGPLVAIIVIVVLIIIGALYFWGGKLSMSSANPQTETAAVAPVSPSDDVKSIEGDLSAPASAPDLSGLNNI